MFRILWIFFHRFYHHSKQRHTTPLMNSGYIKSLMNNSHITSFIHWTVAILRHTCTVAMLRHWRTVAIVRHRWTVAILRHLRTVTILRHPCAVVILLHWRTMAVVRHRCHSGHITSLMNSVHCPPTTTALSHPVPSPCTDICRPISFPYLYCRWLLAMPQ